MTETTRRVITESAEIVSVAIAPLRTQMRAASLLSGNDLTPTSSEKKVALYKKLERIRTLLLDVQMECESVTYLCAAIEAEVAA